MRILQILEAQLTKPEKVPDPDTAQIKPRLQRKGDLVWHLYKFFDMHETEYNAKKKRKNPEYRKALRQIVTGAITDTIEKHGKKSPKWKKINVRKAVTDMVEDLYFREPYDHPDDFFQPYDANDPDFEGYTQADWQRDYQDELDMYNKSVARSGWDSRDDSGQVIRNNWGRKPRGAWAHEHSPNTNIPSKITKQVKALRNEVLRRVAANADRLPQQHFFSKITKQFMPKDNIRVYAAYDYDDERDKFVDWHPIEEIEAKIDVQGNISEIKFRIHGGGTIENKGIENWDPERMRRFFKYYKEHADW